VRGVIGGIGVLFIIAWLVLWLAVKVSFAAIHLLLLLGVIMIVLGLVRAAAVGGRP